MNQAKSSGSVYKIALISYWFSRKRICAVRPISESRLFLPIWKITLILLKTPDLTCLKIFLTILQWSYFLNKYKNYDLSPINSLAIYILADSNGAYESCFELNKKICLKCWSPSAYESRYSKVYSGISWSVIDSCFKHILFFIFCRTHIPASTTDDVLIP